MMTSVPRYARQWRAFFLAGANRLAGCLLVVGFGIVLSTCADIGSDKKKDDIIDDDANVVVIPEGLVTDCESLDSGGSLVPDSGSRSGNVAESQCIEYTFIGEPGITYTVLLTVVSGNADLIVAFNEAYTNLVGTSANSGTEVDLVSFDSSLSLKYFVAISSPLQTSTFGIAVRIGAADVIDITQPTSIGVTPASGSIITEATPIVITFDESMDTGALELGGDMGT